MLEDAEKPLYDGWKIFTKMSTLVNLYNPKAKHGFFDYELIKLLKKIIIILLLSNELSSSMYEVKKSPGQYDMYYEKIHVCLNGSLLN